MKYHQSRSTEAGRSASRCLASATLLLSTSAAAAPIAYNSYTINAAISRPSESFAPKLAAITKLTLGEPGKVEFRKLPGNTPIPDGFDASALNAVNVGANAGGLDAAYVTGLHLNPTWGFLHTSAVPFGPNFDECIGFLFGLISEEQATTGLQRLQAVLDKRGANVVVVANSEQGSGYFPKPLAGTEARTCAKRRHHTPATCAAEQQEFVTVKGIGLAGLCSQPWTLRYVEPALALQRILFANRDDDDPANDIVLSHWPSKDLSFLRDQAGEFLNDHARDTAFPEVDRGDYVEMLDALRRYVSYNSAYWKIRAIKTSSRFDGWTDEGDRGSVGAAAPVGSGRSHRPNLVE